MKRVTGNAFVAIVAVLVAGVIAPAAASAASSISGTVKDYDNGTILIAGVEACAENQTTFADTCAVTGIDGKYKIQPLTDGAKYEVAFFPQSGVGYLPRWYNEHDLAPAFPDLIQATAGDTPNIDARLKKGGLIKGKVTDAGTLAGIEDAEVCISKFPNGLESCHPVGAGGNYTSPTLTPGQYSVAFEAPGTDYLRNYYNQKALYAEAEPVTVTAGGTVNNVNSALSKGSSIAGVVTESGSGQELEEIDVCLYDAVSGENATGECKSTNSFGTYKFGALPLGQYKVGFSEEPDPILKDAFDTQYFNEATTLTAATVIAISSPQQKTGVDAHLHKTGSGGGTPPPGNGGGAGGAAGGGSGGAGGSALPGPSGSTPPAKCKKGFKKKKVKGKTRCVKSKKKKKKK